MSNRSLNPSLLDEIGAALAMGGLLLTSLIFRRWYNRWGASAAEASRPLPGDDLVPQPTLQSTRAITIQAAPETVWAWLAQIGQERGALYSYERLENLAGCKMKNADRIVPEWQQIEPGHKVRLGPKGYPLFQVKSLDPGRALVMQALDPVQEQPGPSNWCFLLEPLSSRATRLISRQRNGTPLTFGNRVMWQFMVEPISFVMERRMLIGIRNRAEGVSG